MRMHIEVLKNLSIESQGRQKSENINKILIDKILIIFKVALVIN
jgi:hypothetical protein